MGKYFPADAMKHVTATLERDKQVILAVIRRFGPISRERIHDLTRIRRSSISSAVREWIREGWLAECGRSNNAMGRKQVLLRLKEDHRFVAGVEFDDETVVAGVMDLHPRVLTTVTEAARLDRGREGLQKQLIACVRKALSRAGVKANSLLGTGVADPGLVDSREGTTITSTTIDFWQQIPLRRVFERQFDVPVLVETRTRAKTVAERTLGASEMPDSMIFVDYGSGIGAGIILDGKLLYGQSCAAGEFGHVQMIQDGPVCKCGSYGCLEAIAGCRAVEARIRRAITEGGTSRALEMAGGDIAQLSGWTVFRAAREGDKISSHIVVEIGAHLGRGLSNLLESTDL